MTPRPRLDGAHVALVPQKRAAGRALLDGRDPGLPLGPGYPHADSLDALGWVEHGGPDDGGWFVLLRDDHAGEVVIGDLGTFGPPDDEGRVEIGYGLAGPFRGRGLGTEAVRLLVDWLAGQPEVRVVTASVEVGNEPSRRLLARLGFALTGESGGHWRFERPSGP